MSRVSRRLVLALVVLVAACSRHRPAVSPLAPAAQPARGVVVDTVAEYVGFYRWPFEHSEFVACGTTPSDRPWWVVPTADAMRQRDSLAAIVTPDAKGPVFVRVRGIAGARMPAGAGHMGGSTRYFRLFEVLDMRKADGASCPVKA
ncbi:hypothetical protein J421_0811 [Gemmatirosa kalamazoonensis]|jgi:hypothetical protein|uniref:Lipoprotein n=1 Tax=Gemmatirosa kalamazoonensis TaxID=861299 RepID=W0RG27_9BACT|nr:hypothetical protein [Gemmatirosa kalamazoonensis]AHG88348.1 hypothetical protein J421_0811 [Gemmatirosa kalamazoonensis]